MGEYGRAMELFKKATVTLPDEADAYFALAQAWIALGKYSVASIAIHTGLRIDLKWAADGPPMILLYGNRRFDFEQHRRALVDASEAFPADITLQFGRAYFEWFDAERDAARLRFEDLRPIVADAAIIDLFLAEP
jgi:tetratricopeptide (TPR) repeat protein